MDPQTARQILQMQLTPWHSAIEDPQSAQEDVLERLVNIYAQTQYGRDHGAGQIDAIQDYRNAFPIATYDDYKPLIERVMAGDVGLLLNEDPVGWAITRGTTKGESKFIPMTSTDLQMRICAGRAMMNYLLETNQVELFAGVNLNLNFPSFVGTTKVGDRDVAYGYSSGIYTKYVSQFTPMRSVPTQDEIDGLGGGKTMRDWERRFELAYELGKDEDIFLVGGVYPTALRFGQYLKKNHKTYPKQIWDIKIMTLGSTPGINTKHQPALNALYGPAAIREIYGTTEGIFGQQRDKQRAWVPNYDMFLFEVKTRTGIKMLHEMRPLEIGSLIVSTPTLPRYRIGDVILAFRSPYYRCIGREAWWTPLRYFWDEITSLNFNLL